MGVHVKYVGPFADGVEILETGDLVGPGETVEVDASVAGKPPKGDDPGSGLLAQPENWQPAKPAKKDEGAEG